VFPRRPGRKSAVKKKRGKGAAADHLEKKGGKRGNIVVPAARSTALKKKGFRLRLGARNFRGGGKHLHGGRKEGHLDDMSLAGEMKRKSVGGEGPSRTNRHKIKKGKGKKKAGTAPRMGMGGGDHGKERE